MSAVLLDVITEDDRWSGAALADAADSSVLVINPFVYSEVSVRFSRIEDLEAALPAGEFERHAIPWPAAFLAGKCFRRYRRIGGSKRSPLPDFYIGAHAAVAGFRLLTPTPSGIARTSPRSSSARPERRSAATVA